MTHVPNIFSGLSAFPLTPANADGIVDTDALGVLVNRLAEAQVDSIGLLGSTGIYAYLDRSERNRAVAAAVEAVAGRVPLIVGVGALRTSWSRELAVAAERAGANGLLLAPMSYTRPTSVEVATHFRMVAGSVGLPLCIYNNPGTTGFTFPEDLIGEIAALPQLAAVKMPLRPDAGYAAQIDRLRALTPAGFAIGYSGDWGAAPSLLAGGDVFFSVAAGLLPGPMLRLVRAAQDGDTEVTADIDAAFDPLWQLFRTYGGLRVMYAVADLLAVNVGDPPLPIQRISASELPSVEAAVKQFTKLQPASAGQALPGPVRSA